jgi:protein-S-isoprenylcysteine O-methyltransferase Ste14
METLQSHFNRWGAVAFFIILYGMAILFMPFYKKMQRKPATAYIAFVIAFAVEMHGIPFSMYIIASLIGNVLPEGILWGHTLSMKFGYAGLYLNVILALAGMFLIISGWYEIYHGYWKKVKGKGRIVQNGIYKHIRHPQYTGLMLIGLGMIFGWATIPTLLLYPVIVRMYIKLAKKEELDMINEFGEEYLMYMVGTKKFIPGFW